MRKTAIFLISLFFFGNLSFLKGEEHARIEAQDLFARGFLYAEKTPFFIPNHYAQISPKLWIDQNLERACSKDICLFGFVIDMRYPFDSIDDITKRLQSALEISEDRLFEEEKFLSGRYCLIYQDRNRLQHMLSDATALRAIYYADNGQVVAGHAKLAAINHRNRHLPSKMSSFGSGQSAPIHTTPYQGIKALTPNTSLTLGEIKVQRFFPIKKFALRPMEELATQVSELVINGMKGLELKSKRESKSLLVSLTAGLDSRTTISLIKEAASETPLCFTYKWLQDDLEIAPKIAAAADMPHKMIEECKKIHPLFKKMMETCSYYKHSPNIRHNQEMLEYFGKNKYIHVRSNLTEIGRAFLMRDKKLNQKCDQDNLFQLFLASHGRKKWSPKQKKYVEDAINEWLQRTHLNQKTLQGYDIRELYHWELNIGRRISQLMILEDAIFDTYIPYNSRMVLDLIMQLPLEKKINGSLQKLIIERHQPELLKWPFNPGSGKKNNVIG